MTSARLSRPTIAAGLMLRRAWAWWVGELLALAPHRVGGGTERGLPVLEVSAGAATLLVWRKGAAEPERIALDDDPAAPSNVQSHVQSRVRAALGRDGSAAGGLPVILRLDPSLVLNASLSLPPAAEADLRDVLTHQIDQLVPLPASAVCFAHGIAPRQPGDRTITVHLAIATRAAIDRALTLARAAGLDPVEVVAPPLPIPGAARPNPVVLLRFGRRDAGQGRRLKRGLEMAALALAILAYGLLVWRLDTQRDDLAEQVAVATRLAAGTRELGREVARARDELAALRARWRDPAPLAVLNEVSALLPDTVWITRFALRERTVDILGTAPRATDLIGLVEGSALFEKPAFRAPITLAPDGRGERFELSFTVRDPGP